VNPHTRIAIVNRLKKLEAWKRSTEVALEMAEEHLSEEGCDCGTDEPGTCALCLVQHAIKTAPVGTHGF
jgi:hypothetical protein